MLETNLFIYFHERNLINYSVKFEQLMGKHMGGPQGV